MWHVYTCRNDQQSSPEQSRGSAWLHGSPRNLKLTCSPRLDVKSWQGKSRVQKHRSVASLCRRLLLAEVVRHIKQCCSPSGLVISGM